MAKIHKISGYVVDIDETFDVEDLKYALDVMEFFSQQLHVETANIGEWNDDNPLNHLNCDLAECEKYFPKAPTVETAPIKHGKWISDLYKEVSELEEKQREFTNRSLNDTEFLTRNGILTGITMVKHLIADFQTLREGERRVGD